MTPKFPSPEAEFTLHKMETVALLVRQAQRKAREIAAWLVARAESTPTIAIWQDRADTLQRLLDELPQEIGGNAK